MTNENVKITYIGHATILIEMNGKKILTDPVLRDRVAHLQRRQKKVNPELYENIDYVLISHVHRDHLDIPSLKKISQKAKFIMPKDTSKYLDEKHFLNIEEVEIGEKITLEDINITVTKANHLAIRGFRSPKIDSLGFMIEGDKTIYFPGDTDKFDEMEEFGKNFDIDVALLPIGGWWYTLGVGHLDPREAAHAAKMLNPKTVIPIHWGTFHPWGLKFFNLSYLTQPPKQLKFWLDRVAPEVDLEVLNPGSYAVLRS